MVEPCPAESTGSLKMRYLKTKSCWLTLMSYICLSIGEYCLEISAFLFGFFGGFCVVVFLVVVVLFFFVFGLVVLARARVCVCVWFGWWFW